MVITGTNFINVLSVLFNGKPANNFVVNSPTQITVIVRASTGLIGVATHGGIGLSAVPFTVSP